MADEIVQHTLTEADKHELCRMAEEMAVLPVQKHTFLETRKRGGDLDVVPGCAGAPVYRDIIGDVSRASRPAVCRAIQNLLLGKRTRLGALALDVARRRQRGDRTLSRPLLPLAAGDLHAQSTVAEDSVTETIEIERGVLR